MPTPQATVGAVCLSALTDLPQILLEEEREVYTKSQE